MIVCAIRKSVSGLDQAKSVLGTSAPEFDIYSRIGPAMSHTYFTSRHQCIGLVAAAFFVIATTGCQGFPARPNTTVGGLIGGTTGSVIGSAIGSREGKTGEGALIGAIAGGITGSAIGNQTDRANLQREQFINEQQQIAFQSAVTMDQVVQLSASGLSDELIINQIQANGVVARPTTNDLIHLKNNGVSDVVIGQIQAFGSHGIAHAPVPQQIIHAPPVIHTRTAIQRFPRGARPVPVFHPPTPVFRKGGRRGIAIKF